MQLIAAALLPLAAAHSSLITPKPRNAIDSELPEWADGNAPYMWVEGIGKAGAPCACRNGSQPCESAQTCLWSDPAAPLLPVPVFLPVLTLVLQLLLILLLLLKPLPLLLLLER